MVRGGGKSSLSNWPSPSSGGSGQESPALSARLMYRATDVGPMPQLLAIVRWVIPSDHRSRSTSLILRMDNLSADISTPPNCCWGSRLSTSAIQLSHRSKRTTYEPHIRRSSPSDRILSEGLLALRRNHRSQWSGISARLGAEWLLAMKWNGCSPWGGISARNGADSMLAMGRCVPEPGALVPPPGSGPAAPIPDRGQCPPGDGSAGRGWRRCPCSP